MSAILIVGGAGYIGSHMVWQLHDAGQEVIVLDNLYSGQKQLLPSSVKFIEGSIADQQLLNNVFTTHDIQAVMHFAAFIEVGESMQDPAKYYQNNFIATVNLLNNMLNHDVKHFIFSSTAAVYGEPQYTPIDTHHPTNPVNPYGQSKLMVEKILADYDRAYGLKSISLRYFNACGADPLLRTGECHDPESHLIPIILQVASRRRKAIYIYGDDYQTPDGTCVRDYIHIMDLCDAHRLALQALLANGETAAYNLGNGQGFSVKQVIDTAKQVTQCDIPFEISQRRAGDPAVLVADATAAIEQLNWQPKYSDLNDIIQHAWAWEQKWHQKKHTAA